MKSRGYDPNLVAIFKTWATWVLLVILLQAFFLARFKLKGPDEALGWTGKYTTNIGMKAPKGVFDFFIQSHIAYDSYQYLSIALYGYDDPLSQHTTLPDGRQLSINYAFFPLYPYLIKILAIPLQIFGQGPLTNLVIAGVIVSLTGGLAASLALYLLGKQLIDEELGLRAAFYFLIFPPAIFLAQLFSEGLFVGLASMALLLAYRGHVRPAALLTLLATFTRPFGLGLLIPIFLNWRQSIKLQTAQGPVSRWRLVVDLAVISLPILAFTLWNLSPLGRAFYAIEAYHFSRRPFSFSRNWLDFLGALERIGQGNLQSLAYYAVEYGLVLLALVASLALLKRHPGIALFSLLVIFISLTSGIFQSSSRYMLAVPAVHLYLAQHGANKTFDRLWTVVSLALFTTFLILFTFDYWVG